MKNIKTILASGLAALLISAQGNLFAMNGAGAGAGADRSNDEMIAQLMYEEEMSRSRGRHQNYGHEDELARALRLSMQDQQQEHDEDDLARAMRLSMQGQQPQMQQQQQQQPKESPKLKRQDSPVRITLADILRDKREQYNACKEVEECSICSNKFNTYKNLKTACPICVQAICSNCLEREESRAVDFYNIFNDTNRRKAREAQDGFHGWPKEVKPHAECPFCRNYPFQVLYLDLRDNDDEQVQQKAHQEVTQKNDDDESWGAGDDAAWDEEDKPAVQQQKPTVSQLVASSSIITAQTQLQNKNDNKQQATAEAACKQCKRTLTTTPNQINYVIKMSCCGDMLCFNDLEKIKGQAKKAGKQAHCPCGKPL